MASDDSTELRRWRAGIWPSTPPPRPGLGFPGPVGLFDGGALLSYDQAEHQGFLDDPRFRHPPPGSVAGQLDANQRRFDRWSREEELRRGEVYLDVVQLDLDDIDAVLDFTSTFGVLDVRALDTPRMNRQWYGVVCDPPEPFRILRHYPGFGDDSGSAPDDEAFRESVIGLSARHRANAPSWVVAETIEEFRWGARAIRDLRTAWLCLSTPMDPRSQEWANPRMPREHDDQASANQTVLRFFDGTMREALEGFSPRLWLVADDGSRSWRATTESPAPADVTLFEVMVLEFFRHIAESATFKRCANESCGRTFVRQDGGAVHRQSRTTGVLYCSRTCAGAVAQRRHRQRRSQPPDS